MLQKYFIAIIPSEPVYSEIETIKKSISEKYNNKSALKSPPHITLHMPFEWKSEKENILIENLQEFHFGKSIAIELKNYGCFEPKVLYVDVVLNNELNELKQKLVQHIKLNLNIFNQANTLRPFHPHITIAFRDLKKADFYLAWDEYKDKEFAGEFFAGHFALLKHNGKFWEIFKTFAF